MLRRVVFVDGDRVFIYVVTVGMVQVAVVQVVDVVVVAHRCMPAAGAVSVRMVFVWITWHPSKIRDSPASINPTAANQSSVRPSASSRRRRLY